MTKPVTNWPPRTGELWVSEGEWPTYGLLGIEGLEIMHGDVFLVLSASEMYKYDDTIAPKGQVRKFVDLVVLFRDHKQEITSECLDDVPDMRKVDETDDIS